MARRLRWIVIALVLLGGLAVGTWMLAGGRVVAAALARALPLTLAPGVVLERVVDPPLVPAPAVVFTATPERARTLVAAMLDRSIPPGAIRHGLTIDGRLDLPEAQPELPLGLRLRADAGLPSVPLIEAHLATRAVNALAARLASEAAASGDLPMALTPILDPGAVFEDAGEPSESAGVIERRFRVTASGRILIGRDWAVIKHLGAQLVMRCATSGGGYAARFAIEIERLDYDPPASWPRSFLPADPRPVIAGLVNARLDGLAPLALPSWTPFDVRVRALLDGPADPPQPATTSSAAAVY